MLHCHLKIIADLVEHIKLSFLKQLIDLAPDIIILTHGGTNCFNAHGRGCLGNLRLGVDLDQNLVLINL